MLQLIANARDSEFKCQGNMLAKCSNKHNLPKVISVIIYGSF